MDDGAAAHCLLAKDAFVILEVVVAVVVGLW